MRTELRGFQKTAVDELATLLDVARYGVRAGRNQAVGLTATTGAGKTIIATALIERIIFGADDGTTAPDPGAVFLWMTDMPKLNAQTYGKMIKASDLLGPNRLVIIENTFDEPALAAGKVYFLNTQKLSSKAALASESSPKHKYPFWGTVKATIETPGRTLYLIVDEAHRGMTEGREREEANSIIQRFIKGIPDVMPPAPIVIGISATPERYTKVVENSARTISQHNVPPGEVRKSGLIKERIAADAAAERQTDALALLTVAAAAWRDSTAQWAAYAAKSPDEPLVVPAFIIQVENEDGDSITKTNLAAVINTITDIVGPLPEAAFAHAFGGEETDVMVGTRKIPYLDPPRIADDPDARVIFFKTSLGTGWDCPRAEVMFSFRRAADATSIAQTIGRMVRTPLARRIEEDERLNSVDVFLPHYNRKAVEDIVKYLRDSGDATIADSIADRAELMSLPRRPGMDAAVAAIEAVPTYTVPTVRERQELRRLIDLARRLSIDGVAPDAFDHAKAEIAALLLARRAALAADPAFQKAVNDEGEIEIDRVEWAVGEATIATSTKLIIPASEETITSLYKGARRVLGGDAVAAYCQTRFAEDPSAASTARLEVFALSQRPDILRALSDLASAHISMLFTAHGPAIDALSPGRRAYYERIRGAAPDPTQTVIHLPDIIEFTRGKDTWPKHLYADPVGDIPLTLNSWETDAMAEALQDSDVVAWLRNTPRDEWALCVPWRDKNVWRPFYPDFLVVRQTGERLVVDILDPHDHTRPDAPKKAQGLAAYARDHGLGLGHIDLIAKIGGHLRRLHLEDEKTRKAIGAADSSDALLALYQNA
jgi:type III restriction enzyme